MHDQATPHPPGPSDHAGPDTRRTRDQAAGPGGAQAASGRLRNLAIGAALVVASVLLSVVIGWHGVASQAREWIPTRLLVELVRREPEQGGPLLLELIGRLARNKLDDAELAHVLDVAVRGDRRAPPGSEAWRRRYVRLLALWQQSGSRPWSERQRLFEIPARVSVTSPPTWPSDAPTGAHLRIQDWWPLETVCRVRIEIPGVPEPLVAIRGARDSGRRALVVEIPPQSSDEPGAMTVHIDRFRFELALEGETPDPIALSDDDDRWTSIQSEVVPLAAGPRVPLEEAMSPVGGPEHDAALVEVFSSGLLRWRGSPRRVAIRFSPALTRDDRFDGVAIGVEVELLEGEFVRRRSHIWWIGGEASTESAWDPPQQDLAALDRLLDMAEDDEGLSAWRLRVTGRADLALRAYGTSDAAAGSMMLPARFWSGSVELPVTIIDREDDQPPRHWHLIGGAGSNADLGAIDGSDKHRRTQRPDEQGAKSGDGVPAMR